MYATYLKSYFEPMHLILFEVAGFKEIVYKLNDNKTAFFTNYADTNAELKKGRQHERIKK